MHADDIANMLFNINDTIETLRRHRINKDITEQYPESQFDEKPTTLMDIPKDGEGSSITIGDCLEDLQTDINKLEIFFARLSKEIDSHD